MRTALIVACLVSTGASAQVIRCNTPAGPVYQQAACVDGRVVVKGPEPLAPDGAGKDLCLAEAPRFFKDPDSVKVGMVYRSRTETIKYHGNEIEAPTYTMHINARNSYGGYAGERTYLCVVSRAEDKVYNVALRSEYAR